MGQSPVRVGITASRKVGGAVQRNRIKRVLREYVRIHLNLFPPSDYNIIAKRGAYRLGYSEACRELDDLLKNISSRLC
jgi:ribonuclease P protein component